MKYLFISLFGLLLSPISIAFAGGSVGGGSGGQISSGAKALTSMSLSIQSAEFDRVLLDALDLKDIFVGTEALQAEQIDLDARTIVLTTKDEPSQSLILRDEANQASE